MSALYLLPPLNLLYIATLFFAFLIYVILDEVKDLVPVYPDEMLHCVQHDTREICELNYDAVYNLPTCELLQYHHPFGQAASSAFQAIEVDSGAESGAVERCKMSSSR